MVRALALLALVLAMPASAHAASLSGTVFIDPDADGIRAPGDTPLGGIHVSISGTTVLTAPDGSWSVDGLGPGVHRIQWAPPENAACTTLGCVREAQAGTSGIDLGVQAGALMIDPGGALTIGRVRLVAPRAGCRSRAFRVAVEGDGITRVEYRVDGRRVAVGRGSGFGARIAVSRLAPGAHRLVAVVGFGSGGDAPAKRLQLRFRRCG